MYTLGYQIINTIKHKHSRIYIRFQAFCQANSDQCVYTEDTYASYSLVYACI